MRVRVRKPQVRKRGGSPFWYVRYWELKPDGKWREVWRTRSMIFGGVVGRSTDRSGSRSKSLAKTSDDAVLEP